MTTSSHVWKLASVVTQDTPGIALEETVAYLRAVEEAGMVRIEGR